MSWRVFFGSAVPGDEDDAGVYLARTSIASQSSMAAGPSNTSKAFRKGF